MQFRFLDPGDLRAGELELRVAEQVPPNPARGQAPSYRFDLLVGGQRAGGLRLRIGNTSDLERYIGHIGYEVALPFRGRRYAERACRLVFPLAAAHGLSTLWITCNPDNWASRRTCERLGARLVEVVTLPPDSDLYARGEREKCRYRLDLPGPSLRTVPVSRDSQSLMGSATVWAPRAVPRVESQYRRIVTDFPVPESIPVLEALDRYELRAMAGQPPVVWHRAEGFQVHDRWGNMWLDWSSGVLITNAGHGRQEIVDAIKRQADSHLLANYAFPSELRAELCRRAVELTPEPLKKIFLLTTGSETVEFAIKVARTHGQKVGGRNKRVVVSFEKAFHGRTLGSQLAGGIPALKEWIGVPDPTFVQVPFPDGYWTEDTSFELFERTLGEHGVAASDVCGVVMETYQGGTAAFAPVEYVRTLRNWCSAQRAVLVFDEVQAGFGRTGTMWGFEHYGVVPDLTTWGKGISSSLPIAAVVGRPDLMDMHPAGSASSTHSGSPVCCAAALANLDLIVNEKLPANAAECGALLHERLAAIRARHPELGGLAGKGLVAGIACVQVGKGHSPDGEMARKIVLRCVEKGLLMFNPVGPMGCTIKICPPLCITRDAIEDGCRVLAESIREILRERVQG